MLFAPFTGTAGSKVITRSLVGAEAGVQSVHVVGVAAIVDRKSLDTGQHVVGCNPVAKPRHCAYAGPHLGAVQFTQFWLQPDRHWLKHELRPHPAALAAHVTPHVS
jgi:hypothetical protein